MPNIIYFCGGLGNQMFQYALYKAIEMHGKSKVTANIKWYSSEFADRRFELTDIFPSIGLRTDDGDAFSRKKGLYLKIRRNRKWAASINYSMLGVCVYFSEKESGVYDKRVFRLKNAAIDGYWQTERYFKHLRDYLLVDFAFPYGEDSLDSLCGRLLADGKSVAVHIRRGDYLKCPELYGGLSESGYYKDAVEYISRKLGNARLYFFSDDIEWVKRNYRYENAVYIDSVMFGHYEAWYDMCLMSCCAHNIIANSSFSWWGAWLNRNPDKTVIAPLRWVGGMDMPDICPEAWIRL